MNKSELDFPSESYASLKEELVVMTRELTTLSDNLLPDIKATDEKRQNLQDWLNTDFLKRLKRVEKDIKSIIKAVYAGAKNSTDRETVKVKKYVKKEFKKHCLIDIGNLRTKVLKLLSLL